MTGHGRHPREEHRTQGVPLIAHVTARCAGCGACLLTCPERAIRPHGAPLDVLADRCTGCADCVEVCPVDAIELIGARE